jgi:hypothetical protein
VKAFWMLECQMQRKNGESRQERSEEPRGRRRDEKRSASTSRRTAEED